MTFLFVGISGNTDIPTDNISDWKLFKHLLTTLLIHIYQSIAN